MTAIGTNIFDRGALIGVVAALVLLVGCGGGDATTSGDSIVSEADQPNEARAAQPQPAPLVPSVCPPELAGCRSAEGRIVYVERVDPDGDGDAHFVIADPQGITVKGMTFIDVRKGLRPRPLPGIGDRISAAGQVQAGSYGQSQIHAVELHVAGE